MERQARVIRTSRAKRQVDLAIAYCLKHFGEQVALDLIDKLEKNYIRIKDNPLIGATEETSADRDKEYRPLIEGYYKLIYTQEGKYFIRIVSLWNCRQDLDKLRTSIG